MPLFLGRFRRTTPRRFFLSPGPARREDPRGPAGDLRRLNDRDLRDIGLSRDQISALPHRAAR